MPGTAQTVPPYLEVYKTVVSPANKFSNVQSFDMNIGRQNVSDPFTAGRCTITGRVPSSLPSLLIGDTVVTTLNTKAGATVIYTELLWRVKDLTINYGEVAAMDTWTLELEDSLAYLGRATVPTRTITAGTNVATAAATICTDAGLTLFQVGTTLAKSSAQTVTGQNAAEVFYNLASAEYAWIYPGTSIQVGWLSRNAWLALDLLVTFSDNNTGDLTYNELEFTSLADNYADKVVVQPIGTTEVVTGTGIFSYNINTYSETTSDATNLGNFLLGILDLQVSRPFAITYLLNSQPIEYAHYGFQRTPHICGIKFRGTTYYARYLGFNISGDQTATYVTSYLMPNESFNYFVLDSTILGTLDNNKLGW